jgi:DNA invertase Pin-like site-specific DNA recombinase
MPKTIKPRAAIYARVSTTDKGQDPKNQLDELRRWCKQQGYVIAAEYVDKESGRKGAGDRAQLRQMMDDAAKNQFDLLVVWALDRLTREGLAQTVHYLRKLDTFGVGFHSYSEPMLSTRDEMVRDILIGVFSALAKVEAVKLSDRTKAGLMRAKKEGRVGGRPRINVSKQDKATIERLAREGMSQRKIVEAINHRRRKEDKLSRTAVQRVLSGSI